MKFLYTMMAMAGWSWAALAAGYLGFRWWRQRGTARRGGEVVQGHEE